MHQYIALYMSVVPIVWFWFLFLVSYQGWAYSYAGHNHQSHRSITLRFACPSRVHFWLVLTTTDQEHPPGPAVVDLLWPSRSYRSKSVLFWLFSSASRSKCWLASHYIEIIKIITTSFLTGQNVMVDQCVYLM